MSSVSRAAHQSFCCPERRLTIAGARVNPSRVRPLIASLPRASAPGEAYVGKELPFYGRVDAEDAKACALNARRRATVNAEAKEDSILIVCQSFLIRVVPLPSFMLQSLASSASFASSAVQKNTDINEHRGLHRRPASRQKTDRTRSTRPMHRASRLTAAVGGSPRVFRSLPCIHEVRDAIPLIEEEDCQENRRAGAAEQ